MSIIDIDQATIEDIARVCHEVNRAYCQSLGDDSQAPWAKSPEWQRTSAINGVRHTIENPNAGPSSSHESWLAEKKANGWVYGDVKDVEKKQHPCMLPYENLPASQQTKDRLFQAVVKAMT